MTALNMATSKALGALLTASWFLAPSAARADIDWYYTSPLVINETITDLGTGEYRYAYSFANTDTSPIWHFGVYLTHVAYPELFHYPAPGSTPFAAHEAWDGPAYVQMDGPVSPAYDARNMAPSIAALVGTHTEPMVDPVEAIQLGEMATGFSFVSPIYDPDPKYYFYETIASGHTQTNGTGKVAAVGLTPEPATLSLLALGGLALLRRRK